MQFDIESSPEPKFLEKCFQLRCIQWTPDGSYHRRHRPLTCEFRVQEHLPRGQGSKCGCLALDMMPLVISGSPLQECPRLSQAPLVLFGSSIRKVVVPSTLPCQTALRSMLLLWWPSNPTHYCAVVFLFLFFIDHLEEHAPTHWTRVSVILGQPLARSRVSTSTSKQNPGIKGKEWDESALRLRYTLIPRDENTEDGLHSRQNFYCTVDSRSCKSFLWIIHLLGSSEGGRGIL